MLSPQEWVLIVILVSTLLLLISGRIRPDLVAILVMLALAFTGLISAEEALSGFSRNAVVTLIGLFIITEGLENTGVVQWIATRIRQLGAGSELRLILLFMGAGAALSLVMNNIAAAAMLLPAALQVGRDSNVRPSKLLIPLAFGTMIGGMATYFTTANIVMSSLLIEQEQTGLGIMDFIPVGGVIIGLCLLYMVVIGRRLLPNRDSVGQNVTARSLSRNLYDTYLLADRLWEVRVMPGSELVNTALSHSRIGEELGITVIGIWRGHQAILAPEPIEVINANDYLLVLGRRDRVEKLSQRGLQIGREAQPGNGKRSFEVDLTEVLIPPRSTTIGKTLKDIRFRNKYGLTSVALWRAGRSIRTDVGITPLQEGDALLMVGPVARIRSLSQDRDFLVLQSSHVQQPPAPQKARWALTIMGIVVLAALFTSIPLPEIILAGAAAMVLTGCISMDEAYRAIEWRVIFLVAGMIPLSIAMAHTGLAERAAQPMLDVLFPFGPYALLVGTYMVTMLLAQFIGGQVTPLVVGAVAISAALQVGINPQAMAVTVAIASSTAFLSPTSHAVNILMMGPGGYRFSDYTKVGLGMTVATMIGLLIGLVVFWTI
jgi:di/tricarboxylate transporter